MNIPPIIESTPIPHRNHRWVWIVALCVFALVLAISIPRAFLQTFFIPAGSMRPTLCEGDKVFANKDRYRTHEPKRCELVVFEAPARAVSMVGQPYDAGHPVMYVKRVIGLPGDHVKIVAGKGAYINGKLLTEPYIESPADYDFPGGPHSDSAMRAQVQQYFDGDHAFLVPPDNYFVLGDNRNQSHDSHMWGLLPRSALRGKILRIFWPPERAGEVH